MKQEWEWIQVPESIRQVAGLGDEEVPTRKRRGKHTAERLLMDLGRFLHDHPDREADLQTAGARLAWAAAHEADAAGQTDVAAGYRWQAEHWVKGLKFDAPAQGPACTSCGAAMRAGASFCGKCGAKQGPSECASCGAPLREGAKFCGKCGTDVS